MDLYLDHHTFHIHAYNAKGLGRVATVEMKRLIGFWEMQSLIITPYEKDMPILKDFSAPLLYNDKHLSNTPMTEAYKTITRPDIIYLRKVVKCFRKIF